MTERAISEVTVCVPLLEMGQEFSWVIDSHVPVHFFYLFADIPDSVSGRFTGLYVLSPFLSHHDCFRKVNTNHGLTM